MMRVLLDTDVVLDGLMRRQPFAADARRLWQACADGRLEGWISAATTVNVFYIARKQKGLDQARQYIGELLVAFLVAFTFEVVLAAACSDEVTAGLT